MAILASSDQAITEEQVTKVKVPTLGIVGPDITLVVVADATHGDQTATPARPEFLAALRTLVASHSAGQ